MAKAATKRKTTDQPALAKSPSGIRGLDEITSGGLPQGRPTLVCGSAGCGKTLFGIEFLVRGAVEQGEPGVFMAFEETAEDLTKNVRSLGFDLHELTEQQKIAVDYVQVERSEIEEAGEYDLEGLFLRLFFTGMSASMSKQRKATHKGDNEVVPAQDGERWELRLYIAGQTPKSLAAFDNLQKLCQEHLAGKYTIEVIDLVKTPQLAKDDQIVALPTLVRKLPEPLRKIIGDLSNTEKVLVGLQLRPAPRSAPHSTE
jgi:hypothetical protein